MAVWQGLGYLVLFFIVGAHLGAEYLVEEIYGTGFYAEITLTRVFTGLMAGIPITIIGFILNKKKGTIVLDPETDQEILLVEKHTYFWIPMQYWGFICIATSVYFAYFQK